MSTTSDFKTFFKNIESLSLKTDPLANIYKRHDIPSGHVNELVDEICLDGGNTIVNLFRGYEGVPYGEIVNDVAEKLKVSEENFLADTENNILNFAIKKYIEKLTPEQQANLEKHLYQKLGQDNNDVIKKLLSGSGVTASVMTMVLPIILESTLTEGAILLAGETIGELIGLVIPFVNIVVGVVFVATISGPAYRKTVPTVIEICFLKQIYNNNEDI